ncbi:MAG: hypothetical protein JNK72_20475 [Myxococcales bacterium]|nr:hypothetical protein [Myxococcales bacterium]
MSDSAAPSKPRRSSADLLLNVGLAAAVVLAFVAWRRARDPHRLWAKRLEQEHVTQIEQPITRCFGGARSDDLRRLTRAVQGGQMPDPFNRCHSGPMADLLVAPAGFMQTIQNPPVEVYRLRDRHRASLNRLSASLRSLELEVSRAHGNPDTAEKREALVRRLEDVVPELEQERQAFEDMVAGARAAASPF